MNERTTSRQKLYKRDFWLKQWYKTVKLIDFSCNSNKSFILLYLYRSNKGMNESHPRREIIKNGLNEGVRMAKFPFRLVQSGMVSPYTRTPRTALDQYALGRVSLTSWQALAGCWHDLWQFVTQQKNTISVKYVPSFDDTLTYKSIRLFTTTPRRVVDPVSQ